MLDLDGFHSYALPISPNWNASTERLAAPSLSASRPPLIPLLSEASLPPLQVTLIHFTVSSFERALRLPTSFSVSGLARHGVKPRLCRSSWRAFASTHPLMLPSTSPREALLACPPSPFWNFSSLWSPPLLLHALALISLFLAKMQLSTTLTLSSVLCR